MSTTEKKNLKEGAFCSCCGSTDNLTIDHIIPEVMGGDLSEENRQILCYRCNQLEKGLLPIDYRTKTFIFTPGMFALAPEDFTLYLTKVNLHPNIFNPRTSETYKRFAPLRSTPGFSIAGHR